MLNAYTISINTTHYSCLYLITLSDKFGPEKFHPDNKIHLNNYAEPNRHVTPDPNFYIRENTLCNLCRLRPHPFCQKS